MVLFIERSHQNESRNMKIKTFIIFLIFVILSLMIGSVQADDGSLQIDTNIQNNVKEQKEIQYIEQESELSKLFLDSTEAIVEKQQKAEEKQNLDERQNLFLVKTKSKKLLETYQPLLFTADTMVVHKKGYSVSMGNRKTPISWQMVTLSILALGVTLYSVYQVIRTRKS